MLVLFQGTFVFDFGLAILFPRGPFERLGFRFGFAVIFAVFAFVLFLRRLVFFLGVGQRPPTRRRLRPFPG